MAKSDTSANKKRNERNNVEIPLQYKTHYSLITEEIINSARQRTTAIQAPQATQAQQQRGTHRDKRSSGGAPHSKSPTSASTPAPIGSPTAELSDGGGGSMADLLRGDESLTPLVRNVYSFASFELSMTSTKLKNIEEAPAHCLFKTHNYTISIFPRPQDDSPVVLPEIHRYFATATLKSASNHIQPLGYSFQHNYIKDSLELVVSFHAASFARNTEFHLLIDVYLDELDGSNKLTRLLSLESDPFYVYSKPDVYVKQLRGSGTTSKKKDKKNTPSTPATVSTPVRGPSPVGGGARPFAAGTPASALGSKPSRSSTESTKKKRKPKTTQVATPVKISNPNAPLSAPPLPEISKSVDLLAKAALAASQSQNANSAAPVADTSRPTKKRAHPSSNYDTPAPLSEPSSQESLPSSLVATPPHKKRKLSHHHYTTDGIGGVGLAGSTVEVLDGSLADPGHHQSNTLNTLSSYAMRMSPSSFTMSPPRGGESSPLPGRFFSSQESTFDMENRGLSLSQRMDITVFQESSPLPHPMKPLKKRFSQDT